VTLLIPAKTWQRLQSYLSQSCTQFFWFGPIPSTITRHQGSWFLLEKSVTQSSTSAATTSMDPKSSVPSRTKTHLMPIKSLLLPLMFAQSSRMPTLTTKLGPRTSGKSPQTPCLCVSMPFPKDVLILCTLPAPFSNSTSSKRLKSVTPKVQQWAWPYNRFLLSSARLLRNSWL